MNRLIYWTSDFKSSKRPLKIGRMFASQNVSGGAFIKIFCRGRVQSH